VRWPTFVSAEFMQVVVNSLMSENSCEGAFYGQGLISVKEGLDIPAPMQGDDF